MLADSIGPALLVILHTLPPAERLAFVLHDMFAVPFDDIAPIVGRSPAAARQLASRARRRVQGVAPVLDTDLTRQRAIVDAFLIAARNGDFDALLEALDPGAVVRSNGAVAVRGAAVAGRALAFARFAQVSVPALTNGAVGVVNATVGRPISLMAFTITGAKIAAIDLAGDPGRIAGVDLAFLDRRRAARATSNTHPAQRAVGGARSLLKPVHARPGRNRFSPGPPARAWSTRCDMGVGPSLR